MTGGMEGDQVPEVGGRGRRKDKETRERAAKFLARVRAPTRICSRPPSSVWLSRCAQVVLEKGFSSPLSAHSLLLHQILVNPGLKGSCTRSWYASCLRTHHHHHQQAVALSVLRWPSGGSFCALVYSMHPTMDNSTAARCGCRLFGRCR